MLTFMFGVLGSIIFWLVYGSISLVIGSILLKKIAPRTYQYITTGDKHYLLMFGEIVAILIVCFALWPVVILCYGVYFLFIFIFKTILLNGLKQIVLFVNKKVPEISIKIGKEEE